MSRFQPAARSSPPPRASRARTAPAIPKDLLNESRSSVLSVPELICLSPEEIEFIDAVLERAPKNATTFLSVFKAYNDVLQERGLDPQHEVLYYGKLLKIGTLKGKDWSEKWEMVKQQQQGSSVSKRGVNNHLPPRKPDAVPPKSNPVAVATRLTGGFRDVPRDEDVFTLHSYQDETEIAATETPTETDVDDVPQYHHTPCPSRRRPISPAFTATTNSLGLTIGPSAESYPLRPAAPIYSIRRAARAATWDAETSEATTQPSTIPPSYGAATRENDTTPHISYTPLRALAKAHSKAAQSEGSPSPLIFTQPVAPSARQAVLAARERRATVINEDEAWAKIRMAQDEQEADRFREDKLVERCWEVWKQGFQWIATTHAQIAQARDNLILRLALHRWRNLAASRREVEQRVTALSNSRKLRSAFELWKFKFREKKQAEWRHDMRARMKAVRDKREHKIKKDAWAKWRQSYRSHLSAQHHSERLVVRYFERWKGKYAKLDHLEALGDHFVSAREVTEAERCWDLWRRAMAMRKAERVMGERVELRLVTEAVDKWKKRMHANQVADAFYDRLVLKRVLGNWKAARDRLRVLDRRATKHITRQNDVLIRAVMRVWKAHERGKLLERVTMVRLLKDAWSTWKRRLRHQQTQEALAVAFSTRSSSALASSALQKWRLVHSTHQNAHSFAVHYHSSQLRFKMLLTWRLELRAKLKLVKQAKIAEKYFILRSGWNKWIAKLQEKRRERKLREFENRVVKRYFSEWLDETQRQRQRTLAAEVIRQRIDQRIMTAALNHWTNRVADMKFRELETAQRRDKHVAGNAFKKWKALCIRHVEELSLMESYQDVKREENMRRMFYRWLTAARKARHRRLLLQQKEEELKLTVVAGAWDKWRERYLDTRLQPMADDFLVQSQRNLVFRAFGIWHSKTKSLPAVRFHASHTKTKFWKIWRDAMPRALQAKAARDLERKFVLTKALDKWVQAYKTKIELKAVARARYLRLPTAVPRQVAHQPRPTPPSKAISTSIFPRRTLRPSTPDTDTDTAPVRPASTSRPLYGRSGIASLLADRPRSAAPSASKTRERTASPTRAGALPKLSSARSETAAPTRDIKLMSSVASSFGDVARTVAAEPVVRSGPPSTATGEVRRSRLWQELRELQLKSRPSSERSRSREPP